MTSMSIVSKGMASASEIYGAFWRSVLCLSGNWLFLFTSEGHWASSFRTRKGALISCTANTNSYCITPINPGTFVSGAAVQDMTHPDSPFVFPEGNLSRAGNYAFKENVLPKQTDQSQTTVCFLILSFLVDCHAGYRVFCIDVTSTCNFHHDFLVFSIWFPFSGYCICLVNGVVCNFCTNKQKMI